MQILRDVMCDEKPEAKVFTPTIVDVNTNIRQIVVQNEMTGNKPITKYVCDVMRYPVEEYVKVVDAENESLNKQLLNVQEALIEIYEGMA